MAMLLEPELIIPMICSSWS